jgi:GNAT superfamily N-acetyltransferase
MIILISLYEEVERIMLRQLTTADFRDFLQLLGQLWPEKNLDEERIRRVFDVYLNDSNYLLYGYEKGSELVGIITVSIRWAFFYEGKVAIIEDLVVREDIRTRGIGTAIVNEMEQKLHSMRVNKIELCSDLHRLQTHRFWKKLGYESLAYQFRKG